MPNALLGSFIKQINNIETKILHRSILAVVCKIVDRDSGNL